MTLKSRFRLYHLPSTRVLTFMNPSLTWISVNNWSKLLCWSYSEMIHTSCRSESSKIVIVVVGGGCIGQLPGQAWAYPRVVNSCMLFVLTDSREGFSFVLRHQTWLCNKNKMNPGIIIENQREFLIISSFLRIKIIIVTFYFAFTL